MTRLKMLLSEIEVSALSNLPKCSTSKNHPIPLQKNIDAIGTEQIKIQVLKLATTF